MTYHQYPMGKDKQILKKTVIITTVAVIALSLYCLDIVSSVIYTIESTAAAKAVLESRVQEPLLAPSIEPLVESLRREKNDLIVQQVQSLIDLKVLNTPESIKELSDRLKSGKAKMTFGLSESTLNKWRSLAEKALTTDDAESKKLTISTLNQEINMSIISILVPRVPESTVRQYEIIKNFIPALPEYEKLSSNSEDKPS